MATLFNKTVKISRSLCSLPTTARYVNIRLATTTPSGAILPEPQKTPFGALGLLLAVVPGLLIGATISKKIANFLEENELFVPSDDDDDDD